MLHPSTTAPSIQQQHGYPLVLPTDVRYTRQLPSALVDLMAMTLCDIIPIPQRKRGQISPPLPELIYFILKTTYQAQIPSRTAVVALIYLERAKVNLPRHSIGTDDTRHRLLLGALLVASKFLQDGSGQHDHLTNRKVHSIWYNLYTLQDISVVERAFLKLLRYQCWVDDKEVNDFIREHRTDLRV